MAILDIFNRKETYQGYVLSNKVDKELQKRLIEAGRGDEINSFTPDAVKKGNEMMNVTANSTPAFIINKSKSEKKYDLDFLSIEKGKEIIKFHESFDMYEKTPLRDLSNLAKELGVEKVFVKDESYRFNLNAFNRMATDSFSLMRSPKKESSEGLCQGC